MLLKKISLRNFRCFESIDLRLDEVTVLIGENNTGKTSLLEALRICLSRSATRKGIGLNEYDHHLSDENQQPETAQPLSITLEFVLEEDPPAALIQALGELIVTDAAGIQHLIFRISSEYNGTLGDFESRWDFLNTDGDALTGKSKTASLLLEFQNIKPVIYLNALRDIEKEFSGGSRFWLPFLKNTGIHDDEKKSFNKR